MRVLFALPGLHRYNRGAEVAFISIARELVNCGDIVTLIGSGLNNPISTYRFIRAPSIPRESFEAFPSIPVLRSEYVYEEFTFAPQLLYKYRPAEYDITVTCSYPFTNWILRRFVIGHPRPPHVFVTQNGDWPATSRNFEYRLFGCEGLICTNPDYYERNRSHWRSRLIPNGIDCERFHPGPPERHAFDLPSDQTIVLMVSALISSKRVERGIEAVSLIPGAHLVVAGDGPLRQSIAMKAASALPNRFTRLSVSPQQMPALYRSADVFLHLSNEEAFGNVFLEAVASGIPVVAPNSARLRWIVGEKEFLFDEDSPEAISSRIQTARKSQRELWQQRDRIQREFSWPKIAAMYRSFLQEVIASSDER